MLRTIRSIVHGANETPPQIAPRQIIFVSLFAKSRRASRA
jgi:hypothetical protein